MSATMLINGLSDSAMPISANHKAANSDSSITTATRNYHASAAEQRVGLKEEKIPADLTRKQARKLAEFYENKNVLITGVTGFIGKICLLKLMHSLKSCGKVYVMLRPKKGASPQQRFNKLLAEDPFSANFGDRPPHGYPCKEYIKAEELRAIDWSKVIPVEGDMSAEDLGLSAETKKIVCDTVDIIFNIAASVQFDAPLKQNLRDNYIGVKNMLHLATQLKRLVSLVHVSTFYTNSHISHVEEKVLPMQRDCEKMAELISWIPDSLCDTISPTILEDRPNTYIFTKAMAENLVQKYQGRLPIAIVRPSIVTPAARDPYPGWVDNVNGPMGLGVLASLGILRNIDWNYDGVADVIPVDTVVNTMLTVAERTPRLYPEEIKVYNCSSSSICSVRWGKFFEILREESVKAPPYKLLRVPIHPPTHKRASRLGLAISTASELLFAYFIDFLLMIFGQKQLLTRLTAKLHHGYKILLPFTTTSYSCSNDNLLAAFEELQPEDKKEFNFDLTSIDWREYFKLSYYGARQRLLKEDIENVPAALRKFRVIQAVELLFQVTFYALIVWCLYRVFGSMMQQPFLAF